MAARSLALQEGLPEKVIQFGEGKFLRAFACWMIQQMNEKGLFNGRVVVVQPLPEGLIDALNRQDGLYTVVLRGIEQGKKVERVEIISAVSRGINPYTGWPELLKAGEGEEIELIISNTTEAGITYLPEEYIEGKTPRSFPGKLAALLYHRFQATGGSPEAGLTIIPCELIPDNGKKLKEIVLRLATEWRLPGEFSAWVKQHNRFCNTLVDRIVTGYPAEETEYFQSLLGYEDPLLTIGEPFHLWVIDGPPEIAKRFPLEKAGLNVKRGDVTPYRDLKVRLLNGPHIMMVAVAFLAGADTVQDVMEDDLLRDYIREGIKEIYPTVALADAEKISFVEAVMERFANPHNKHYLQDIALNSVTKFKERLIPVLLAHVRPRAHRTGAHGNTHTRGADRTGEYCTSAHRNRTSGEAGAENERLPETILLTLAGLLVFNRPVDTGTHSGKTVRPGEVDDGLQGKRGENGYVIADRPEILAAFAKAWSRFDGTEESLFSLVAEILGNMGIWGENLHGIPGLTRAVSRYLAEIIKNGMRETVEKLLRARYKTI
jgi:tagaturonate reductase